MQTLNDVAMVRNRIEEIMQAKGMTKAEFARIVGIKPQNVNTLLNTDNLKKLMKIAEVIGCDVADFLTVEPKEPQPVINGYIELKGEIYRIKNVKDLNKITALTQHKSV